jgi:hypothetical protein
MNPIGPLKSGDICTFYSGPGTFLLKGGYYFLLVPAAASRATPIAPRMVAIPTGVFSVTALVAGREEDGVAVTIAEVTGAFTVSCDTAAGAVVVTAVIATVTVDSAVVADTVLPILWIQ